MNFCINSLKLKHLRLLVLTMSVLGFSALSAQTDYSKFEDLKEGQHYELLVEDDEDGVQYSTGFDGVELAVIFSYSCPHCFNFYKEANNTLIKGTAALDNVKFVKVPVTWNKQAEFEAKLYWAFVATNQEDKGTRAVYHGLHNQGYPLRNLQQSQNFIQTNNLDYATISRAFDSFKVRTNVRRTAKIMKSWKIRGTPQVVVGGRYLVKAERNMSYGDMATAALTLAEHLASK